MNNSCLSEEHLELSQKTLVCWLFSSSLPVFILATCITGALAASQRYPYNLSVLDPTAKSLSKSNELSVNDKDKIIDVIDIPIVLITDGSADFQDMMVLLSSIVKHQKKIFHRLFIYFVLSEGKDVILVKRLQCYFPSGLPIRYEIYIFDERLINAPMAIHSSKDHNRLLTPMNWARFYLHKILPENVKQMIYIDTDCVVTKHADLAKLFDKSHLSDTILLEAVPRNDPNFTHIFNMTSSKYMDRYDPKKPNFNNGFFQWNLDDWRNSNLTTQAEFWMTENARSPFFALGTNPVMILLFYDKWSHLNRRWNVKAKHYWKNPGIFREARIIHWAGTPKPWEKLNDGVMAKKWMKYYKSTCFDLNGVSN